MALPSDMVIEKLLHLAKENPKDKILKVPLFEVALVNQTMSFVPVDLRQLFQEVAPQKDASGIFYQMDGRSRCTMEGFQSLV